MKFKSICRDMNLPIWIDPTNAETNLVRNKIRHIVLPILEESYPGCSIRIATMARNSSHDGQRTRSRRIGRIFMLYFTLQCCFL